jgi:hypothetical protein
MLGDNTIEREQSQLAAQSAASLQARVKMLERRANDLQHQLWTAQADNARLVAQLCTVLTILAAQGSLAAQSALAAIEAM